MFRILGMYHSQTRADGASRVCLCTLVNRAVQVCTQVPAHYLSKHLILDDENALSTQHSLISQRDSVHRHCESGDDTVGGNDRTVL